MGAIYVFVIHTVVTIIMIRMDNGRSPEILSYYLFTNNRLHNMHSSRQMRQSSLKTECVVGLGFKTGVLWVMGSYKFNRLRHIAQD